MMFPEISSDELEITKGSVKRLATRAGVSRMTDDAAVRVAYEYEVTIMSRLQMAKEIANHAGRETVKEEDLILAERLRNGGL